MILQAAWENHDDILKLAKLSKYTRDFGHMMFSGKEAYEKGWIRVALRYEEVCGFTCVRHKVRSPETTLYFIGIGPEFQRIGLGAELLADLKQQSPHRRLVLNVMKDNIPALKFYEKHGFKSEHGDAIGGKAFALSLTW